MTERRQGKKGTALRKGPGTDTAGAPANAGGDRNPTQSAGDAGDGAFDRWLEDKLRNAYSSVLEEAIPEDLLRLLQQKLKD